MPAGASVTTMMGPRALKGIAEQVELFAIERRNRGARTVDPNRQMVPVQKRTPSTWSWQGTVIRFCFDARVPSSSGPVPNVIAREILARTRPDTRWSRTTIR